MARNLRKFTTEAEYSAATLIYPSVSLVTDTRTVHFDKSAPTPPAPPALKYKLTLSDGSTVSAECDGTSAVTSGEVSPYSSTLVSAEIGNDCVSIIGDWAFRSCYYLTSIDIPSGVTTIGDLAFNNCYSLTSVTIGNGVTTIGDYAFAGCFSLTSIDIPDSVTSIESTAFNGCSGLTEITVNATTPPTLGSNVFDGSTSPIYVPAASVETYKSASGWSTYASRIQAIPTPSYLWVSYTTGDTVPTATTAYGVKLYANYDEGYNVIFSGTTGDYIKFHPNGNFGQWAAENENGNSIDISSYYQAGSMMYTIEFSDLGLGGMNIISPTTIFEDDIDLYT